MSLIDVFRSIKEAITQVDIPEISDKDKIPDSEIKPIKLTRETDYVEVEVGESASCAPKMEVDSEKTRKKVGRPRRQQPIRDSK